MHEHYWSERNRSRLEQPEERATEEGQGMGMGSERGDPRDRMPSTIQRRKPGTYGDSTRPAPGGVRP